MFDKFSAISLFFTDLKDRTWHREIIDSGRCAVDDVERTNDHRQQKVYESWHYFEINKDFVFVDENGFGDFRLKTPYFGYPR